jgi:hypothetical protein
MGDFFEQVKRELFNRLASPLLGGFVVSWVLWNYKFLIILASKNSISTTFILVEKYCFPDLLHVLGFGVFLPLFTALLYVYAYPYPAEFVYRKSRLNVIRLKAIKDKVEGATLLTVEESRRLYKLLDDAEIAHAKQLNDKIQENNSLKDQVKRLAEQVSQLSTRMSLGDETVQALSRKILKVIHEEGDSNGILPRPQLLNAIGGDSLVVRVSLDALAKNGFVNSWSNDDREVSGYVISPEGRRELFNWEQVAGDT